MMSRTGNHGPPRYRRPLWALALATLCGLLVLAACGAEPTPAPATIQSAATAVAPTVAAARSAVAPTVAAAQTQVGATVQTGATQVAPTVAAAQTQVGATVSAVAPTVAAAQTAIRATVSAIAPTVAAAQTAIAPTVAAAQTAVAPTVAAAQTAIVATLGPPIATTTAASSVQITSAQISQANSTIVVTNSGPAPVNISGWILLMGTFPAVLPVSPNLRIQPGATVTLHLASGTDSPTDVYLGQAPQPLINNLTPGTRLALINLFGQVASIYQIP